MVQALADQINTHGIPEYWARAEGNVLVIEDVAGNVFDTSIAVINAAGSHADAVVEIDRATVKTRVDGINYYDIKIFNIDLGSGDDVFNIQGTSAITNLNLGAGDERVYVSSTAEFDTSPESDTDFLLGHLHDVDGMLNIDVGTGRHKLMISDEAATVGDGDLGNPVLITDDFATANARPEAQHAVTGEALLSTEIYMFGLAEGAITYKANSSFAEGIDIWAGYGDDTIVIDGTHYSAGLRTITSLSTGLGDDSITVDLNAGGDDGFFVLYTQGPYNDYLAITDDDTVDASASTLPLVIFGGQGHDDITSGSAEDIVFGDRGRVLYFDDETTWIDGLTLDELEAAAATVLGYGGPGDKTDGVIRDPVLITTVDPTIGGDDVRIVTGGGDDIVFGGINRDTIDAGEDNNIVLGDSGFINYVMDDDDRSDIDRIESTDVSLGGNDQITTGAGDDIIIGGEDGEIWDNDQIISPANVTRIQMPDTTDGDTIIHAGNGYNVVFGDNGQIRAAVTDAPQFGAQPITLGLLTTITPDIGGNDDITTGIGKDIVFGGALDDTIVANDTEVYLRTGSSPLDEDNIILGDNGFIDYTAAERIYEPTDPAVDDDSDPSDIDRIAITDPTIGGIDNITSGAGFDFILGGTAGDTIRAGAGNDLVFGDHGKIEASAAVDDGTVDARALPLSEVGLDDTFIFTAIYTQDEDLGGNDVILGEDGEDIILGQQDDDRIYGGNDNDDIIGGHNVPSGHDGSDRIDGGSDHEVNDMLADETDHDVIAGDNASILRRGDTLSPRIRVLDGDLIYDSNDIAQVTTDSQYNPTGVESRTIVLFDHSFTPLSDTHGDDYIAGGPDDDVIFGQLGNDTIQGDGAMIDDIVDEAGDVIANPMLTSDVYAERLMDGTLDWNPSFELESDGDDYIEGNGGNDTIFGNLGQDDLIGGNSDLFGLNDRLLRPDGTDFIFGGAGTDLERNDLGQADLVDGAVITEPNGHSRDADMILGDNGRILRLIDSDQFLEYSYDQNPDNPGDFEERGDLRILVRAAELLDYTVGGLDYDPTETQAASDIGAADELHGESSDDFVYGQVGNDVLFGEGQDDDLIGGYGHDWISGGTGDDGVLGDDGRIYTSRNGTAEPLYGIAAIPDGGLNLYISTPGKIQQAIINVSGKLKKTVNLTPFKLGDPEAYDYDDQDPGYADDIIYGGWGDDSLHGGPGDDAMSGAEALPEYYESPSNDGNVLRFGEEKAGEFAAYDEYDPWRKILVDDEGVFTIDDQGVEFLLNFDHEDTDADGYEPLDTHSTDSGYDPVMTDGDDVIFGDLGNDWLVGGTGKDHLYGGYGSDLLNADDNHDTTIDAADPRANNEPDTHPSYEDIGYGGAGRDVLIANTGGDRIIDWAGEFNSYIVPYAPFGAFTISRSLQPQLMQYLYDLSKSDGADPTRSGDTGADPARNGEPEGELGLVMQKDPDWHDQTGAPDDPQAGNIAGGKRDVLRSATFNSGTMEAFAVDSGVWGVQNNELSVAAESLGGDAVAVFHVGDQLPTYFEIVATINVVKPTGGWKANSYVIFDYQNEYDFKFAGINVSIDKIQMGHRDETGWHVDVQDNLKAKPGVDYNMLVAINGVTVTVVVDGVDFFSHTYEPRIIHGYAYGLNSGWVGVGSDNSRGTFDNISVQVLPPEITFEGTEEFPDTHTGIGFAPASGGWNINGGRYDGTPVVTESAASLVDLGLVNGLEVASILQLDTTLNTESTGGVIFDYYGPTTFKFAAISAESNQIIIGHHTDKRGWSYDAVVDMDIKAGKDYDMEVSLKGTTVSVSVKKASSPNWEAMVGYVFNAVVVDGEFGFLTKDSNSSFDEVTIMTDDPAFIVPEGASALMAATEPVDPVGVESTLTYDELDPIIDEAISRWSDSMLIDDAVLEGLDEMTFLIVDLSGSTLALAVENTILIDVNAAGHGWFVDATPQNDAEFLGQNGNGELVAGETSEAYGEMDLLTVVMHELGHVFGFLDLNPDQAPDALMSATLETGVRHLPGETATGQTKNDSNTVAPMDLTPDPEAEEDTLTALVGRNPWLVHFLQAQDDDIQSDGQDPGTNTEETSDPADDPPPDSSGNGKGKK
jgi:Ca2+-binding RTX toxin-like protein